MSWETQFRDQTRAWYKLAVFANFFIVLAVFLTIGLAEPIWFFYALPTLWPLIAALSGLSFVITFRSTVEYVNLKYANKIEKTVLQLGIGFGSLLVILIILILFAWIF